MIKRTTIKLYGELPKASYTVIPNALIYDEKLTPYAKCVALYLWSLGDGFNVSTNSMAKALGIAKSTVLGAIQNLIDQGWLGRNEYTGPSGGVNKYEYVVHRARRIGTPKADQDRSADVPVPGQDRSSDAPLIKNLTKTTVMNRQSIGSESAACSLRVAADTSRVPKGQEDEPSSLVRTEKPPPAVSDDGTCPDCLRLPEEGCDPWIQHQH